MYIGKYLKYKIIESNYVIMHELSYLQQNTKKDWKTIFKTKPQNIIQKTKWKTI